MVATGVRRMLEVLQVLQMLAGDESPEVVVVLALLGLMFSPVWVNANTNA